MTSRSFLDTNVLVYSVDMGEQAKRAIARALLAGAGPGTLAVSSQVLGEFYVTVTRKLRSPIAIEIAAAIVQHLASLPCVPVDTVLVRSAIDRSRTGQVAYWDALIIEAALAAGCTTLLTEDLTAGQRFDGLTVVNPFA